MGEIPVKFCFEFIGYSEEKPVLKLFAGLIPFSLAEDYAASMSESTLTLEDVAYKVSGCTMVVRNAAEPAYLELIVFAERVPCE